MSTAEGFDGNFASANMISEGTAFKTVPNGFYTLQVNKTYEFNGEEGWARLGAKAIAGGMPRGSVFFKVQWKEERGSNGKLKTKCRLYVQLLKALHPQLSADELSKIDAKELLGEAEKYPVDGMVSEFYVVPDTSNPFGSRRVYPKSPEEVATVRQQGGTPRNDVISISPVKA